MRCAVDLGTVGHRHNFGSPKGRVGSATQSRAKVSRMFQFVVLRFDGVEDVRLVSVLIALLAEDLYVDIRLLESCHKKGGGGL